MLRLVQKWRPIWDLHVNENISAQRQFRQKLWEFAIFDQMLMTGLQIYQILQRCSMPNSFMFWWVDFSTSGWVEQHYIINEFYVSSTFLSNDRRRLLLYVTRIFWTGPMGLYNVLKDSGFWNVRVWIRLRKLFVNLVGPLGPSNGS